MMPRYKVHNSISNSNSYHGTRDTTLKVIVYHFWDYYNEDLMEGIRKEHVAVNDNMDTSLESSTKSSGFMLTKMERSCKNRKVLDFKSETFFEMLKIFLKKVVDFY